MYDFTIISSKRNTNQKQNYRSQILTVLLTEMRQKTFTKIFGKTKPSLITVTIQKIKGESF